MLVVFIFLTCFMELLAEQHLLMSVTGEVARENYSYYSLVQDGAISLQLHSLTGDADLYISQVYSTPTYEPDTYCLQSSTCGLDIIHVPKSFRRPLGIAVYGHPSHESSSYLLEVLYHYDDAFNEDYETVPEPQFDNLNAFQTRRKIKHGDHLQDEDDSVIWDLAWSFIDILLEVMFLATTAWRPIYSSRPPVSPQPSSVFFHVFEQLTESSDAAMLETYAISNEPSISTASPELELEGRTYPKKF